MAFTSEFLNILRSAMKQGDLTVDELVADIREALDPGRDDSEPKESIAASRMNFSVALVSGMALRQLRAAQRQSDPLIGKQFLRTANSLPSL